MSRRKYLLEVTLDIEYDHDNTTFADEEWNENTEDYEYEVDYDRLRDTVINEIQRLIDSTEGYEFSIYSNQVKVITEKER